MAHRRLKIPSQFQTRAAFEPSTFDEKAGTIEVVFTTGARGLRRSWEGPFYEELEVSERAIDLSRLNNGAPFMDDHPYRRGEGGCRTVLGVVERAWVKGNEGRALVRFSEREEVQPIKRDVQTGILRHVSVGYTTEQLEKIEEVDGVPVYRATRWTPFELSQTPVAFDDGATVRSRPDSEFHEVEVLSTAEETRAMPDVIETPATPKPVPTPAVNDEAIRAAELRARDEELGRVTAIRSLVAKHNLGAEFESKLIGTPEKTGPSVEQARAMVLDELAARSAALPPSPNAQHARVEAGEDNRDKFVRGASAWLFERAGVSDLITRAAQKFPDRFKGVAIDGGEYRGMTLVDIVRECLERDNVRTRGMNRMDLVGLAFTRAAYQSTSDFAILFENVLRKGLVADYLLAPDTWSRFCKTDTVADFRDHTRYRTGSIGDLEVVPENGEIPHGVIPDGAKLTVNVQSYAKIVGLSRKAIINDDMGALTDVSTKLGRGAKRTIEKAVYALLNANGGLGPTQGDAQPFFHANRANVNATGAALSCAAIDADRVVMAAQKDPSGNDYLGLAPAILLVPSSKRATAFSVNNDAYDHDAGKLQKKNPVGGLFRDIVDTPRLTDGDRRYLFADPSEVAAIVVAFLEGSGQAPSLEVQKGWDVDGVEWKVGLDFKAQMHDPKGAVTNAGK